MARAIAAALERGGPWLEPEILAESYGTGARLRLTSARGLSPAGAAVRQALVELPARHGLEPKGYHAPRLTKLSASARVGGALERAQLELTLADGIARLLRDLGLDNTAPASRARLWGEGDRRPEPPQRPPDSDGQLWGWRFAAEPHRYLVAGAARARAAREERAPDPRIFSRAYVRWLIARALGRIDDAGEVAGVLAGAVPPARQYDRLVEALARYRAVVAAGGWRALRRHRALRRGGTHEVVARLRQRLTREGYLGQRSVEQPRLFDEALVEAVRAYQRNHLLEPTGRPDPAFFSALNVPAARRLAAVERGLRRWRTSGVGGAGIEVRINIPGFSLEVWRGPRRLLRQRVVVGKRHGTRCDEDLAVKVPAYATPTQAARIKRMVFAPYWNVTHTIKETELDPERGKDPLFYEKHGYEVLRAGTPFEWVRQLPGPENALGLVKFLFPNPHQVYLHDTPQRRLFARPRRAFSHGCIRVADAFGLARLLLSSDGQWQEETYERLRQRWRGMRFAPLREEWDEERYAKLVEDGAELRREVHLRRPIPIHVEYHLVRVDDQGRVAFYEDLYRLEHPRRPRRCVPDTVRARRGYATLLERLTSLEQGFAALSERVTKSVAAGAVVFAAKDRRHRRLRKRLKGLERFATDHANLAARIRAEHASLEGPIHRKQRRRVAHALRVQRLLEALEALHRRAQRTCERVERLQAASRPVAP